MSHTGGPKYFSLIQQMIAFFSAVRERRYSDLVQIVRVDILAGLSLHENINSKIYFLNQISESLQQLRTYFERLTIIERASIVGAWTEIERLISEIRKNLDEEGD